MAKVLFVCTGNVCRSPMAEALFRHYTKKISGLSVASAGISAPDDEPPSPHSVQVLKKRGIDISGFHSQQLSPRLVEESSHIFSMTFGHKAAVEALYPSATEKSFLLREFIDGATLEQAEEGSLDVPDPIGLNREAYELTYDLIMEALPGILTFLRDTDQLGKDG